MNDIRQMFGDMGLGGDGINGGHIYVAEPHSFRRGDSYFHANTFTHGHTSSSCMTMAWGQHSWAQIPQPLQ
jgi:hypothetical protein